MAAAGRTCWGWESDFVHLWDDVGTQCWELFRYRGIQLRFFVFVGLVSRSLFLSVCDSKSRRLGFGKQGCGIANTCMAKKKSQKSEGWQGWGRFAVCVSEVARAVVSDF